METRKLYYEDCLLREFTARVVNCEPAENGYYVKLDATAFYPEGGGQACDIGTLGDANVLDVQEQGEQVVHLCDKPLEIGSTVTGTIDWERRFDLMQQHAGEHILSGVIFEKYGYHNVGFHVGKEVMEVDFDGVIPAEDLSQLELAANKAIWENTTIRCFTPDPEELEQLSYRTKRVLPWPVRIVEITGYDRCACCGIHTATTGQIGLIKILTCTKFHAGVRLEMVCGQRAYRYLHHVYEQNRQVSQMLSAKVPETAEGVARLCQQLAAEKFRANQTEKRLFATIAANYKNQKDVVHFEDGLTPGAVRELADAIGALCDGIAVVLSGSDDAGYAFCLISKCADVRPLGAAMIGQLNGRGGGRQDSFQGSLKATQNEIDKFFAILPKQTIL